jgi:hypothetical protein
MARQLFVVTGETTAPPSGEEYPYPKAWAASFPPDLWPAEEIEVGGRTMLRLKDGAILETQ